jgi:hypothetical protein
MILIYSVLEKNTNPVFLFYYLVNTILGNVSVKLSDNLPEVASAYIFLAVDTSICVFLPFNNEGRLSVNQVNKA